MVVAGTCELVEPLDRGGAFSPAVWGDDLRLRAVLAAPVEARPVLLGGDEDRVSAVLEGWQSAVVAEEAQPRRQVRRHTASRPHVGTAEAVMAQEVASGSTDAPIDRQKG